MIWTYGCICFFLEQFRVHTEWFKSAGERLAIGWPYKLIGMFAGVA